MKVLLIDDKVDELKRAMVAARTAGWSYDFCNTSLRSENHPGQHGKTLRMGGASDWIEMMDGVDGVVTDLMWNHSDHGEKPMGLLVVIHALSKGKPVVVCTNCGEYANGGHNEAVNFILAGYLNESGPDHSFDVVRDKNWKSAMECLSYRMKRKKASSKVRKTKRQ